MTDDELAMLEELRELSDEDRELVLALMKHLAGLRNLRSAGPG